MICGYIYCCLGMPKETSVCSYNLIIIKCYMKTMKSKNDHFLTSMWEKLWKTRRPAQFENKWNVLKLLVYFHVNGLNFDIVSLYTFNLLQSWRTKGLKNILTSMWAISHVYVRFLHRHEISHRRQIFLTEIFCLLNFCN